MSAGAAVFAVFVFRRRLTPDRFTVASVFFGVTRMLPLMRDGGSLILTGSIASAKVLDDHAVYAGTKAAIGAFARNWAMMALRCLRS